jgi:uncharacterized protein YlaI
MQRKCFCCEKVLKTEDKTIETSIGIVYSATIWRSTGNYGSKLFDSMKSEFLEAYICDECLEKKKNLVYLATIVKREKAILDVKPFEKSEN